MKTLIICYSVHHKNTQKIAEAIAAEINADSMSPEQCTAEILMSYDLIGFGSGIYAGRHHASLFKLVDTLPALHKRAFVFSTRAIESVAFYHKSLIAHLKKKDITVEKEFSCRGFATYGPLQLVGGINKGHPTDEDILHAREFAKSLIL